MSAYLEFISNNSQLVKFQVIRCIDNKTLKQNLFLLSNVFCDGLAYYISSETNTVQVKAKDLRIRLSAINSKMRLSATDNDFYNTRLIYAVVTKAKKSK